MAKKGLWRSPRVAIRIIERQRLFVVQGGRCAYCGEDLELNNITFDHVWPRSRQAPPDDQNLVLACPKCNRAKGRRDPQLFVKNCRSDAPIFQLHPELRQN